MASYDQYFKQLGKSGAVQTGISLLENISGQSKKFQRRSKKAAGLLFAYDAFQNFLNRKSVNKLRQLEESFAGPLEEVTNRYNQKQKFLSDVEKYGGSYTFDGDKINIENRDKIIQSFVNDELGQALGQENLVTRGNVTGLSDAYRAHLISSGTAKAEAFLDNQGKYDWSLRTLSDQKKFVKDQLRLAEEKAISPSETNPIRVVFNKVSGMFGPREDLNYEQKALDYINNLREKDKQYGSLASVTEFTGPKYRPRQLNTQQINTLIRGFNDGTFKLQEAETVDKALARVQKEYENLSLQQNNIVNPDAVFAQVIGTQISSPTERLDKVVQDNVKYKMDVWRKGFEKQNPNLTNESQEYIDAENNQRLQIISKETGTPLTLAQQSSIVISEYNRAEAGLMRDYEEMLAIKDPVEKEKAQVALDQRRSLLKKQFGDLFKNDPQVLYITAVTNVKESLQGPDVNRDLFNTRLNNYIQQLNAAIKPINENFDASTLTIDQIASIIALNRITPFMRGTNSTLASLIGYDVTPELISQAEQISNLSLPTATP